MVKFRDYYQILGVPRTATDKEVKAAYRKLARQHHPDANKGNKASEEKFKEISEAYEVLKDPEKRHRYDTLGSNYQAGADFRPPPDFGGFSFDFGNLGDIGKGSSFSDFFEMLFGSGFSQSRPTGARTSQGAQASHTRRMFDQEADIELTVEELAHGAMRTLKIDTPGAKSRTLEVKIPAGTRAGAKIRVPKETARTGATAGDLYLRVKVKPHAYFTVEGDNLVSELPLNPAIAVVGGEVPVRTIDGHVRIRIPSNTQNGRMLRLKGKGLPKVKDVQRGDQLVRIKLTIPHNLTEQEQKLYEELARIEQNKANS